MPAASPREVEEFGFPEVAEVLFRAPLGDREAQGSELERTRTTLSSGDDVVSAKLLVVGFIPRVVVGKQHSIKGPPGPLIFLGATRQIDARV